MFGTKSGFSSSFDLSTINGTNGFKINGGSAGDFAGASVAPAGDLNGDGVDDLIISASGEAPGGLTNAGAAYVIFGKKSGFSENFQLSLVNGANGFRIPGLVAGDRIRDVSSAGDVNGDGIDDIIVGATGASPGGLEAAGSAFVIFGKQSGFAADFDLASLNGSNGFRINGLVVKDYLGTSVSSAGDINGDGYDDIVVGAPSTDPGGVELAGSSYIIFGQASGFSATIGPLDLNGDNGFQINGTSYFAYLGDSVSAAGDVNNDGIDDLLLGATYTDPGGAAHVIFGKRSALVGGPGDDTLAGGPSNDIIQGEGGHDTLLGNGADDDLDGGTGNDFLDGGTGADKMSGGTGNDIYIVDNADDQLTEAVNAGDDTVRTSISAFTLGANFENLEFLGSGRSRARAMGLETELPVPLATITSLARAGTTRWTAQAGKTH